MVSQLDQTEVDALLAEAEQLASEVSPKPAARRKAAARSVGVRPPAQADVPPELQRILQLEVPVIVQLAERAMSMEEVLDLNVGTVIEFDRSFEAELELIVTNRRIGLGRAVKVGENFGLRVTRIGTIYDTIRALGG